MDAVFLAPFVKEAIFFLFIFGITVENYVSLFLGPFLYFIFHKVIILPLTYSSVTVGLQYNLQPNIVLLPVLLFLLLTDLVVCVIIYIFIHILALS